MSHCCSYNNFFLPFSLTLKRKGKWSTEVRYMIQGVPFENFWFTEPIHFKTLVVLLSKKSHSNSQMEQPVWNTVWNFIVIISPFYHINKKVRLHFFAIKIQSFHAALNSDAEEEVGPNLESMAWKFSHFLRFFPKIIKVLWNAPYSTTFI